MIKLRRCEIGLYISEYQTWDKLFWIVKFDEYWLMEGCPKDYRGDKLFFRLKDCRKKLTSYYEELNLNLPNKSN